MDELIISCEGKENLNPLSNYAKFGFYNGQRWATVCHYYQTSKFKGYERISELWSTQSPFDAEEIGTNRYIPPGNIFKKFLRKNLNPGFKKNWKEIRFQIMKEAITAKVVQNYEVRKVLLESEKKEILVEANNSFWGYEKGGQNKLGEIYMEIRSELTKDGFYDEFENVIEAPWFYSEMPSYSGYWRQGYAEDHIFKFYAWYEGLSPEGKNKFHEKYPTPDEDWTWWVENVLQND